MSTKKENWWKCDLHTGWADTWRSAAFHYAEGYEGGVRHLSSKEAYRTDRRKDL